MEGAGSRKKSNQTTGMDHPIDLPVHSLCHCIHTVTAYLYCGLPGRGFWLTAILAPRFLASAFAAGPSVLILLCYLIRKISKFDPGWEAIQTLSKIVCYALIANVFSLPVKCLWSFTVRSPATCPISSICSLDSTATTPWCPGCGLPSH